MEILRAPGSSLFSYLYLNSLCFPFLCDPFRLLSFLTVHIILSFTMASAARSASRVFLRSTPATSSFRPAARSTRFAIPQSLRASARRGYSSEAGSEKSSSSSTGIWAFGIAALGAGGVYFYLNGASPKGPFVPTQADYQKVYDAIALRLQNETDYDDGSYGPVS